MHYDRIGLMLAQSLNVKGCPWKEIYFQYRMYYDKSFENSVDFANVLFDRRGHGSSAIQRAAAGARCGSKWE